MKKIFLLSFMVFVSAVCYAQEGSAADQTKQVGNQIMRNVYNQILAQKDDYQELSLFDEKALSQNKYGFYQIEYRYDYPPDPTQKRKKKPFEFALTVQEEKDPSFMNKRGYFDFPFPALGLKLAGYQRKRLKRAEFNLLPLIKQNIYLLNDHQQEHLPLKLYIKPLRDTFETRENIEFEVILKNVSKGHKIVKLLDDTTLLFKVDNRFWVQGRCKRESRPMNERPG